MSEKVAERYFCLLNRERPGVIKVGVGKLEKQCRIKSLAEVRNTC